MLSEHLTRQRLARGFRVRHRITAQLSPSSPREFSDRSLLQQVAPHHPPCRSLQDYAEGPCRHHRAYFHLYR